ncbi:DinB family protein [Paenibacillus hamazuiensis]|uniref:DinB family protein n=1 Tax=Paenibacillus hamazuiensis TaxID=2936508 RepID=UPI00200C17C7|nr:DinB family protein [Paenibacillus hamazuiensis]
MDVIQKMFDHIHWANLRILEGLRSVEPKEHEKAIKLFAHILHSERVWFTRLQGKDSSHIPIWPELDISACSELVSRNHEDFNAYLATVTDANVNDTITYRNQTGRQYTTSIRDILTHLALHGQYHRGQINSLLRAKGEEPVNVDFITYVR